MSVYEGGEGACFHLLCGSQGTSRSSFGLGMLGGGGGGRIEDDGGIVDVQDGHSCTDHAMSQTTRASSAGGGEKPGMVRARFRNAGSWEARHSFFCLSSCPTAGWVGECTHAAAAAVVVVVVVVAGSYGAGYSNIRGGRWGGRERIPGAGGVSP